MAYVSNGLEPHGLLDGVAGQYSFHRSGFNVGT
jgi:hypothetical protein